MDTKERILEATEQLFLQFGYNGTGLKKIGSRSDAPFGSIYHHFPGGKEALAEQVIMRSGRYYRDLVMELIDPAAEPAEAIKSVFVAAAQVLADTDYRDACPVATVALEVASSNERLRLATAAVFDDWIDAISAYLLDCGVPESGAYSLSVALIELLQGAFLLSRAAKAPDPMISAGEAAHVLMTHALPKRKAKR